MNRLVASTAVAAVAPAALALASRAIVVGRGRGLVVERFVSPPVRLGIVLGAGLRPDGSPTNVLARRVTAAAQLYHRGVVDELVMSGDDNDGGDQPAAMQALAVELGVAADRIALDHTGVDTAATCRYVARTHPGRPVALITQAFHAHRTAFLTRRFDLDAVVLATPDAEVKPRTLLLARLREIPAAVKALFVDR